MKVKRTTLRMTREEGDAFLAAQRWARVATVGPDGEPHVSPVGYVALDGRIYFYATADARRARDVQSGSRVAVCVDAGVGESEGYDERKGVVVYGTCRVVGDDETELIDRVRPAYAKALFGDASTEFRRRTHVWFEVDPYRRVSWDFGKIPAGADSWAKRSPGTGTAGPIGT
jgi:nitroimidazol reductase NimA-like FMN-containing flavoprotein (pyridoxamine 5'-phosphate oxidase superfamily)